MIFTGRRDSSVRDGDDGDDGDFGRSASQASISSDIGSLTPSQWSLSTASNEGDAEVADRSTESEDHNFQRLER
jgi:hypothetical protein